MLFPVVMAFGADGDREALKRTLVEGNRVAVMLVAGASVCLIGFSGPLIRRWMGPGFDGSVAPFVVLALAGVIIVSQAASSNVLIAVGAHRLVAWIWIGEAVANLSLSVWLVRTMGLVGVAVGTFIPFIVGHGVVMLTVACRKVGVPIASCLYQTLRPAAIAATIATAACVVVRRARPPATATAVLIEGVVVGLVYLMAFTSVGLDRSTRRRYAAEARALARTLTFRRRDTTAAVSTVPGQEA